MERPSLGAESPAVVRDGSRGGVASHGDQARRPCEASADDRRERERAQRQPDLTDDESQAALVLHPNERVERRSLIATLQRGRVEREAEQVRVGREAPAECRRQVGQRAVPVAGLEEEPHRVEGAGRQDHARRVFLAKLSAAVISIAHAIAAVVPADRHHLAQRPQLGAMAQSDRHVGQIQRGLGTLRAAENAAAAVRARALQDAGRVGSRSSIQRIVAEADRQLGVARASQPRLLHRTLEDAVLLRARLGQRDGAQERSHPLDVRPQLRGRELGWKRGRKELVVGHLEDVGVDQRAATNAAAGDDVQVLERVQLEETVDVEQDVAHPPSARPSNAAKQLAEAEHAARKIAPLRGRLAVSRRAPPRAALEHEHAEPALRESRGADRTAEARADDDDVGSRHAVHV